MEMNLLEERIKLLEKALEETETGKRGFTNTNKLAKVKACRSSIKMF